MGVGKGRATGIWFIITLWQSANCRSSLPEQTYKYTKDKLHNNKYKTKRTQDNNTITIKELNIYTKDIIAIYKDDQINYMKMKMDDSL